MRHLAISRASSSVPGILMEMLRAIFMIWASSVSSIGWTIPTIRDSYSCRVKRLPDSDLDKTCTGVDVGRTYWLGATTGEEGNPLEDDGIDAIDLMRTMEAGEEMLLPGEVVGVAFVFKERTS